MRFRHHESSGNSRIIFLNLRQVETDSQSIIFDFRHPLSEQNPIPSKTFISFSGKLGENFVSNLIIWSVANQAGVIFAFTIKS